MVSVKAGLHAGLIVKSVINLSSTSMKYITEKNMS